MMPSPLRREILRGLLSLPLVLPALPALAGTSKRPRQLILVELKGGNDDLNAFPPYRDPLYRRLRPNLAIPLRDTLTVDAGRGFHPALRPLLPVWDAGELALVQGIGMPEPDLSHFRAGKNWETGRPDHPQERRGWLPWAMSVNGRPPRGEGFDAAVLDFQLGAFAGNELHVLQLNRPEPLQAAELMGQGFQPTNEAQRHLAAILRDWQAARSQVQAPAAIAAAAGLPFPDHAFGRSLQMVVGMMRKPAAPWLYRVQLGGFDTHHAQLREQAKALGLLSQGLVALRGALQADGRWKQTVVAIYSEFGRRAHENGNNGTDHGTAGVAMVMGGGAQGGWIGSMPSLERLDGNGNVIHTVDYRRLYNGLLGQGLALPRSPFSESEFPSLPLFRI